MAGRFRSPLLRSLRWRGLIADSTRPRLLDRHLSSGVRTVYIGFDPTADSLHVGSLLPLLALRRAQRSGHRPIVLIGGGTGLIGDPSGKAGERQLNPAEVVAAWASRLKAQVQRFVDYDRGRRAAILADNYEWLSRLEVIGLLRDIGKHFPLGSMLAKESVRSRMGSGGDGISYTEFSYQILQAYDFLELFRRHGCTMQMGGSDQWGNITAGIRLIARTERARAFGITFPLVTKSDGTKFGKTETDSVWLDPQRTTPYEMYQFWLNTADRDVVAYLKNFTFLRRSQVRELAEATRTAPERREAQRHLASAATALVHGRGAVQQAEGISAALFGGTVESLTAAELAQACRAMPSTALSRQELTGLSLVDLLVLTGLSESRGRARELLTAGGLHVNGDRARAVDTRLAPEAALHGKFMILRKGRRTYHAVTITEP